MTIEKLKQMDLSMWAARLLSLPAILFVGAHLVSPEESVVPVPWEDWVLLGTIGLATAGLVVAWLRARIGGLIAMGGYLLHLLLWPFLRDGFAPTWWMLGLFIGVPGFIFWWLSRRD